MLIRRAVRGNGDRQQGDLHTERREIKGQPEREVRLAPLRDLAVKVRHQDHRERGLKVYSLYAP
jgi:hypothetical protein